MAFKLTQDEVLVIAFTAAYIAVGLTGLAYLVPRVDLSIEDVVNALIFLDRPIANDLSILEVVHYVIGVPVALIGAEVLRGCLWELVTSLFVHANIYHLLLNSVGLLIAGRMVSALTTRVNVFKVFLIGGLVSNLTTAVVTPNTLSIGASGGIFSVLAATSVIDYLENRGYSLMALLAIVFALSSLPLVGIPNVLAHAAGVLTGLALGLQLHHRF